MTRLTYEWTGTDGTTKIFNTYPEVVEWKEQHGGSFKQLSNYKPSQDVEYCREGAAGAAQRWKNYKF